MLYFPNYARALRCIGQALQNQNIEVFELRTDPNEFRVQCEDPNPPYTALIELKFSPTSIEILDREGPARRHQTLRAVGAYIDNNRGQLLRLSHCSLSDQDDVEVEYQTRDGNIRRKHYQ
jgi:hypothetical protein